MRAHDRRAGLLLGREFPGTVGGRNNHGSVDAHPCRRHAVASTQGFLRSIPTGPKIRFGPDCVVLVAASGLSGEPGRACCTAYPDGIPSAAFATHGPALEVSERERRASSPHRPSSGGASGPGASLATAATRRAGAGGESRRRSNVHLARLWASRMKQPTGSGSAAGGPLRGPMRGLR